MIGTTLQHRYHIEAELGHGGMGVVYRALDTLLDRAVAVKVVSSTALGTDGEARLLREARAVAKLNHPGIMAVYDAGEVEGQPFIVMELIEGQTLRARPPETLADTLDIAQQICAALAHAHAKGIIHRDLKPENVMRLTAPLNGEPHAPGIQVKLMDFGLAFSPGATRLTQAEMLIGTVAYLAPEIIAGQPASPASDLYAFGVLCYELLAGRLPFTGGLLTAILSQHLYAPVTPASTYNAAIPPALDLLLLRLLAKRPEDRPASASEVREALNELRQPSLLAGATDVTLLDRIVRGRLIGREPELAEAGTAWQKARAGISQVVLISGEPGIGKTRFAHELIAQVRLNRGQVLWGDCYAEGGPPYAPLAQAIQSALDPSSLEHLTGLAPAILADLITLAPALRATWPDVPSNPPLDALAEQQRLFESAVSLFSQLTCHAPVLLVIDDAHWADSATLALLRHLARRAVKLQFKLLTLLTYREVELAEARPFHGLTLDLNRERLATRLKLTRLDQVQTRDLLTTMFQAELIPEFLTRIYLETEGNPYFIEEVCKALVDAGQLTCEHGRWQCPNLDEIEVPQSVRLAIEARISKLPPAVQETLRLAAVLGREFEYDTLHAMSDLGEEALIEALELAQRAQLIAEVPRAARAARLVLTFAHALIPTALREGLSSLRRRRLHHRAAQAIERIHGDRVAELAAALGYHYAEAGEGDQAIAHWLRAGDQARRMYAYQEAIAHYQHALAFMKDSGPGELPRAARTAMNLGGLYHSVLKFKLASSAYDEAFALWQRANEAPQSSSLPAAPHALRGYWIEIQSLDLTLNHEARVSGLLKQLFSGLVELGPDFDLVPMLARRWEILDDGRRYIFQLRRDARWSDGQRVTAHDFDCAWRRVLDPALHSPNAEVLLPIKHARAIRQGAAPLDQLGLRVLDDFTLAVDLEEPTGYFLQLLTCDNTFAIPRHVVEAWGAAWCEVEHLVTNGPFRLAEWVRGDRLSLTRNPDYRGQFSGNLSRVELTLRPVAQHLFDKYDADEHDVSWTPDSNMILPARRRVNEQVSAPMALTSYIGFDVTRPPFDDVRVRQAFAHAVNRTPLAEIGQRQDVAPATGGLVPPGLPGYSPGISLGYDPERAQGLLAEAGYPQGHGFPAIEAWVPFVRSDRKFRYLHDQWREHLGIEITWQWQRFEYSVYVQQLATNPPNLFITGWAASHPDPDDVLRVALHQPGVPHWYNPRYEQLLTAAQRVSDPVERLKFYQAADRLLMQEAAIIPLTYGQWNLLIKPWVKQYPISALESTYWKDVIIEPH